MTEHLIHQFPEFPFSHVSQSNPAPLRMPAYQSTPHPEHDETARRASSPCGRFSHAHDTTICICTRIRRRKSLFADRIR